MIFQATSTNYAAANHRYVVTTIDLITGAQSDERISADPVFFSCVFDAMPYAKSRVEHYMPLNGLTGFQVCAGAIRKIRVNVGEEYGTPVIYYPGIPFDFIIWNGIVDFLPFGTYLASDYVYTNTGPNRKYFAGVLDDLTFDNRSNFLYCLSTGAGDFTGIQVRTYNAAGALIGTSNIANPFAASATYTNKYVSIDVGHKGLSNIPGGLVTGTYPIITTAVTRYEIYDTTGGAGLIKTIRIGCDRYKVMTVHYLAKNGAFLTCNFNLIHNKPITKTGQTYKKNPNTRAATSYGYTPNDAVEHDLNVTTQTKLILRTDWLSDEQITAYIDCFSSPKCYIDEGPGRSVRIRPTTGDYDDLPHYSKKLRQLTMEYNYAHQNYRQDV
jgi:hypothetical protein